MRAMRSVNPTVPPLIRRVLGYNHFEEGHSEADKPADAFPKRGRAKATWRKAFGPLVPQPSGVPRLDYPTAGLFD